MIGNQSVLHFCNDRAKLQSQAGSKDTIAKTIEMEELAKPFRAGMEASESGCGNGIFALGLARQFDVKIDAFDFSPEIVKEAKQLAQSVKLSDRVNFSVETYARIRTYQRSMISSSPSA